MIKLFLIERRSWIYLFLSLQGLWLFITYLDPTIPYSAILYVVFLSSILMILFLIARYQKESQFYRSLSSQSTLFDVKDISAPGSPFEYLVANSLSDLIVGQKEKISQQQLELEQERDELLAWIHEIKTPLTAMNLMIERMDHTELKTSMNYEWLRIHLLLDQQLHQKRISWIENDLKIAPVSFESFLYSEIKNLQSWCIQKGVGFEIDLAVTEVLSDAKWLSFIVRQLLTNSVKYSDFSDIRILSFQKDGQTHFSIQDSGRGIDSKDLPRIFDKGFTSTTFHRGSGATGMGLYLAKKAADALFIQISVDSSIGIGTNVTLTFPKKNQIIQMFGV